MVNKITAISRLYDNLGHISGSQDITYALQSNFTMKHIPFPTYDLQSAIKTSPDRVDAIIRRMQVVLLTKMIKFLINIFYARTLFKEILVLAVLAGGIKTLD